MQSDVPSQYRDLLKQAIKEGSITVNNERPLKKRKKHKSASPDVVPTDTARNLPSRKEFTNNGGKIEVISLSSGEELSNQEGNTTEVDLKNREDKISSESNEIDNEDKKDDYTKNNGDDEKDVYEEEEDDDEEDEDYDSDEFEDVDLEHAPDLPESALPDYQSERKEINIPLKINKRKKKRQTIVSRQERQFRKQIHVLYLFTMVAHGVSRNSWCSDPKLLKDIKKGIQNNIRKQYLEYLTHRKLEKATVSSKTRRLLDILRQLMIYWYKSWTINEKAPTIYKRSWDELDAAVSRQRMSKRKFIKAVKRHTGSRDIAAQGFVSLLRSIGIQARLIFSLQPPDFTNLSQVTSIAKKHNRKIVKIEEKTQRKSENPKSKRAAAISQRDRLLNNLRVHRSAKTRYRSADDIEENEFEELFPVFWCEVWDKDAKRFITVDPIVKKTIEIVKTKSVLEPPTTSEHNNAYYVLGYDRLGGVRDITRRYTEHYNAKVRKKRITRDEDGNNWYNSLLRGACTIRRNKQNRIDKFEELEFEERSLREGMPNSIQDFKNHPIYVLESQLKANEVLRPRISCGSIRKKNKYNKTGELVPVYKRSNVQIVRSAKAWYMRGRVLKIGERPMKSRKKSKFGISKDPDNYNGSDAGEDEDDVVRLYAESQTKKFVPPAVVGGEIPRNAFGNIDVYRPWMIPEGCVHIPDDRAERAAKIMGISFVPAAVGFDFDGGTKGGGSRATVKIQGVVTFKEYEPAVKLICQGLQEYDEEKIRRRTQLIAFRAWKILFKKMDIINRLNIEHGKVSEQKDKNKQLTDNLDSSDENEQGDERNESDEGGFILGDAQNVDENMYFGDQNDEIGDVSDSEFENDEDEEAETDGESAEEMAEEPSNNASPEKTTDNDENIDSEKHVTGDMDQSSENSDDHVPDHVDQTQDDYEDFMNKIGLNSVSSGEYAEGGGGFVIDDTNKLNLPEENVKSDEIIEERDQEDQLPRSNDIENVDNGPETEGNENQEPDYNKNADGNDDYETFMHTIGLDKSSEKSEDNYDGEPISLPNSSLEQDDKKPMDEEDAFIQDLSKDLAGYTDNLSAYTNEKKHQKETTQDTEELKIEGSVDLKDSDQAVTDDDVIYMSERKDVSSSSTGSQNVTTTKPQSMNSNEKSPIEISSDSSAEIIDLDDGNSGEDDGYEFEYSDSM